MDLTKEMSYYYIFKLLNNESVFIEYHIREDKKLPNHHYWNNEKKQIKTSIL